MHTAIGPLKIPSIHIIICDMLVWVSAPSAHNLRWFVVESFNATLLKNIFVALHCRCCRKVLLLPSHSSPTAVAKFSDCSGNAVPPKSHSSLTATAELSHWSSRTFPPQSENFATEFLQILYILRTKLSTCLFETRLLSFRNLTAVKFVPKQESFIKPTFAYKNKRCRRNICDTFVRFRNYC